MTNCKNFQPVIPTFHRHFSLVYLKATHQTVPRIRQTCTTSLWFPLCSCDSPRRGGVGGGRSSGAAGGETCGC